MRKALMIVVFGFLLAACTNDPYEPAPQFPSADGSTHPAAPSASPSASASRTPVVPTRSPSASPSPSGFSEAYVVQCNGRPSGEQVLAAVRKSRPNLPSGSGVTVKNQPLCAGMWQYTVLSVTSSEPLQVITKGSPQALIVVTAGTDPCTVEVRATAPPALLNAADC